jgi:hypothetical protein
VSIASDNGLRLIHDVDVPGLDAAAKKFEEIVNLAKKEGYAIMTLVDIIDDDR